MAQEAVYMRIISEEMGHKQTATPIQTGNAMVEAVINAKITHKRSKAMDMCSTGDLANTIMWITGQNTVPPLTMSTLEKNS
jgi:hypothetical protein